VLPLIKSTNDVPSIVVPIDLPKPPAPPVEVKKPMESHAAETPTPTSSSGPIVASDDAVKTENVTENKQSENSNSNITGTNDADTTSTPVSETMVGKVDTKTIRKVAEVNPSFDNMGQFIQKHLVYPTQARSNGTTGTVYISFVVEPDGSLSNIKVEKGIGDGCEQEAMRVIGIMPKWSPGTIKSVPVRVQCNLPIKFRLNN
jgi:protein TonB